LILVSNLAKQKLGFDKIKYSLLFSS